MTRLVNRACWLAITTCVASVAGCDLREVIIPEGEPMLIVQGVMRPDLAKQFVVVERTFVGQIDTLFEIGAVIPEVDGPQAPVDDATVTVSNLDLPNDPCGSVVEFVAEAPPLSLTLPGVYWSPPGCPTMRPGDRLSMQVETPDGERVTGISRLPGLARASLVVSGDSVEFGDDSRVTRFNRDRDTLRIRAESLAGRLMQVEVQLVGELDEADGEDVRIDTRIFADTTAITLPGDLIDAFERGDGDDVFRGGRNYKLTVAITDTNYFDFARSFNNPFTGRGFINRLEGGLGVFGSLAALTTRVRVEADQEDAREGIYDLVGQVQGVDVSATLTLYLARPLSESEVSGFVDGSWFQLAGQAPPTWVSWDVSGLTLDGTTAANSLTAVLRQATDQGNGSRVMDVQIRGAIDVGASFVLELHDLRGFSQLPLGSLTATKR